MITAYAIIALVALARLIELPYSARNTSHLLARGAIETGRGHYPFLILLHIAWLATMALALPKHPVIHWLPLGAYVALQALRIWIIATLGPWWTTKIITLPGMPLVKSGPYKYVRHPNYWVVVGEIAILPLVFGEVLVAIVFSILNAGTLAWRIREEDAALADRRVLS
ncbi:MAG TPA: isoprenylcysteine carboxylmethyltransferase family protein [Rhizomicrobium sp.]|jgi:methyltransferase|nr:isoprenylcysteine carboxylmethyltransferase family protein [Rhizomicrobium sp.]